MAKITMNDVKENIFVRYNAGTKKHEIVFSGEVVGEAKDALLSRSSNKGVMIGTGEFNGVRFTAEGRDRHILTKKVAGELYRIIKDGNVSVDLKIAA